MINKYGKIIFSVLSIWCCTAIAEETRGTWNLIVENDSFTGTDRDYTSGVQLSYLSAEDRLPNWLRAAAALLPAIDAEAGLRAGFQFGHAIFTPRDIERSEFLAEQRPYSGWLYGGVAVVAETEARLDTWLLNLGVVGQSARGEELQNNLHRLIGSPEAKGWDNEIKDRFAGALIYERRWRNLWQSGVSGYGVDLNPHLGFSLGSVGSYINAGLTLRIGNDLRNDFGPPRIRPSLPGSGYFTPRDDFAWYLFAGIDSRAVGYNLFLEGNTAAGRGDVDVKRLVGDAQAGLVVMLSGLRLSYTYVYRGREFEQQDEASKFGSLALSFKF